MASEWSKIIISYGLLIAALYGSSIGLVFFQQWYLQEYNFPFFATAFNQLVRFLLSWLYRILYTLYTGKERITLSWRSNLRSMAVLGFISGIHMALSNWSLYLNTMSLFTVSKSTSVIFVLLFGILMHLEKNVHTYFNALFYSCRIITIVFMISSGLALFTYKAVNFNIAGFMVAISSSFMSGLRWTYAQYILQKSDLGLESPFDIMFYVDAWACITNIPFVIFTSEGAAVVDKINQSGGYGLISFSVISALLAFAMEVTKYAVISRTSSLTESILGIAKEIATLILAFVFLNEEMSFVNFIGLVLCLGGVTCHAVYKYRRAKKMFYFEMTDKGLNDSFSSSDEGGFDKHASYLDLCHP